MNNVYLGKDAKLQNRNRSGMIRSYRTTPSFVTIIAQILHMLLCGIDNVLDILARPAVRRAVRSVVAIACVAAFLCLISAVESRNISIVFAVVISAMLVGIEVLCLRGN